MTQKHHNPFNRPVKASPTPEAPPLTREQQWLDVVTHPAPDLPPYEPAPAHEETHIAPVAENITIPEESMLPHSGLIRGISILVLTIIFLLSWQQKVGEESAVNQISAASILDR